MSQASRIGLGVTVALHVVAVAALLSYEPMRKAVLAAAPIMVELIAPPRIDPPKSVPPQAPPKPLPVMNRVDRPVQAPMLSAPAEAPSPVVAPLAPDAPTPAIEPAPVLATQPIYDANYLDNPAPAYPAASRRAGEQGRVILRVRVGAAGQADEVQVRTSSGFLRLDEAAQTTVQRWKFIPAKRGGEAIAAWVLIPISFRLER